VVRLVVTGGSLTRKTEKVTSLSPGRYIVTVVEEDNNRMLYGGSVGCESL